MKAIQSLGILLCLFIVAACSDSSSSRVKIVGKSTSGASAQITRIAADGVVGGAKSLKVPVWGFYLSKNADCTDPVTVKQYSSAQTVDFFQSPTLFEESPAADTYNCMIIEMEDVFTFRPDATSISASGGVCTDTDYYLDIYRTDSGDTWKNSSGTAITATGSSGHPGSDRVFIFATITPAAPVSGALGVSSHQVVELSAPIVISADGQKVLTFDINTAGKVATSGTECGMNPCSFSLQ
jgi:hypothetical protein